MNNLHQSFIIKQKLFAVTVEEEAKKGEVTLLPDLKNHDYYLWLLKPFFHIHSPTHKEKKNRKPPRNVLDGLVERGGGG